MLSGHGFRPERMERREGILRNKKSDKKTKQSGDTYVGRHEVVPTDGLVPLLPCVGGEGVNKKRT